MDPWKEGDPPGRKLRKYKVTAFAMDPELKAFIMDYAAALGISRSAAVRRLTILGARCEAEHAKMVMPQTYNVIDLDNIRNITTIKADASDTAKSVDFYDDSDW
jgi:hypothetical protein